MPCEYGPAAAGALSVAINSCALTVVEILCFFIWCFLAADSTHKLRAVMDDDWYACMISCVDNKWRIGHVCVFVVGCSNVSHVWWEHNEIKERITNLRATNETTTHTPKQTNGNKPLCVFAFAGETRRDDTHHSFQLYTHNAAERRALRDQRQNTKLANSLV